MRPMLQSVIPVPQSERQNKRIQKVCMDLCMDLWDLGSDRSRGIRKAAVDSVDNVACDSQIALGCLGMSLGGSLNDAILLKNDFAIL